MMISLNGWNGGTVYYAPNEKHLYVRKDSYRGKLYLVCHDTVLKKTKNNKKNRKNNKKDQNKNEMKCPGRCIYNPTTGAYKMTRKHNHRTNHEIEYKDLVSLNAMKDLCRFLAKHLPGSAHKIPVREIFLMEMAKYDCNVIII